MVQADKQTTQAPGGAHCRFCNRPLDHSLVDLGLSPLCESFRTAAQTHQPQTFYPLHARVCDDCFLVQIPEFVTPEEIFGEYAYFSSYSDAWLDHARRYVDMIVPRLGLNKDSYVVELASNDGYLLRNFVERGIPNLGIEPARNVAAVAREEHDVPTRAEFFGQDLAGRLRRERAQGGRQVGGADLILGNNVLAQVPDLHDFVGGIQTLLAPQGTVTIEFPHLMRLMAENQFDTIYHEHFCYFSLHSVEKIFAAHGLTIFDVEELWTHGGSLRIYARHESDAARPVTAAVEDLRRREAAFGIDRVETYAGFEQRVQSIKRRLLEFLIQARDAGQIVVGYGAPGKGNTLLNYCGIRSDLLGFTVDRNPYKHGRFTPGTHVPIHPPEKLAEVKPDYVLILPWNLRREIAAQLGYIKEWGGKLVVPIPRVEVFAPGEQAAAEGIGV